MGFSQFRNSVLAYVHNAEDQIRGEAATLSFFRMDSSPTQW